MCLRPREGRLPAVVTQLWDRQKQAPQGWALTPPQALCSVLPTLCNSLRFLGLHVTLTRAGPPKATSGTHSQERPVFREHGNSLKAPPALGSFL